MRASLPALLAVIALAGCRPETARPEPVEDRPRHPAVPSSVPSEQPPAAEPAAADGQDAGADAGTMSPEQAREAVPEQEAGSTGILKVLKDEVGKKKTPDILSPGRGLSEEEMKAIDEALGTLEKKPPPPLEKP